MSTRASLLWEPASVHLYEQLFEEGELYLELHCSYFEATAPDRVLVRLPKRFLDVVRDGRLGAAIARWDADAGR